jgi:hypothetical protein
MGNAIHVYGAHAFADDRGPGDEDRPLRTIGAAAERAGPGDEVWIHAGVYRERVRPARSGEPDRPILYAAMPGHDVVVRGSMPWAPEWEAEDAGAGLYRARVAGDFFEPSFNPLATPLLRSAAGLTVGQLFADERPLRQTPDVEGLRSASDAWCADGDGRTVWVRLRGGAHPRSVAFEDDRSKPVVRADRARPRPYPRARSPVRALRESVPLRFWNGRGGGGAPQGGAVSTRSGHHWRITECVIRDAVGIGLDCGAEGGFDFEGVDDRPFPPRRGELGGHVIADNRIADNGACGIACAGSTGTVIEHNVVERSNRLGFAAPETPASRCTFSMRVGSRPTWCGTTTRPASGSTTNGTTPA